MYVEKTTGLTLLLMMWFSEILSNKPSTYINWPYFMRGGGVFLNRDNCVFLHPQHKYDLSKLWADSMQDAVS